MANRLLNTALTFDKKYVTLNARVAVGSTGAPTLQAFNPVSGTWGAAPSAGYNGIKSVARNSAGNYTFTLQDSYVGFRAAWVGYHQDAAPAAVNTQVMATGTNVRSATAPAVTVQCRNASGTATDPASGEVMIVDFEFTDSTAT